jgi:hypothetical protein
MRGCARLGADAAHLYSRVAISCARMSKYRRGLEKILTRLIGDALSYNTSRQICHLFSDREHNEPNTSSGIEVETETVDFSIYAHARTQMAGTGSVSALAGQLLRCIQHLHVWCFSTTLIHFASCFFFSYPCYDSQVTHPVIQPLSSIIPAAAYRRPSSQSNACITASGAYAAPLWQ